MHFLYNTANRSSLHKLIIAIVAHFVARSVILHQDKFYIHLHPTITCTKIAHTKNKK